MIRMFCLKLVEWLIESTDANRVVFLTYLLFTEVSCCFALSVPSLECRWLTVPLQSGRVFSPTTLSNHLCPVRSFFSEGPLS